MSQIYLNINNQQAGPYNIEAVNQMLTSKQITPETLGWMQGMANWETVQSDTLRSLGVGAQSSSNSSSSKKIQSEAPKTKQITNQEAKKSSDAAKSQIGGTFQITKAVGKHSLSIKPICRDRLPG